MELTWHGLVGAEEVAGVVGGAKVGDVLGSGLLCGSKVHSLEKDTSSSATCAPSPVPCSYLKTILG